MRVNYLASNFPSFQKMTRFSFPRAVRMKMRSVIWHIDFDAECAKSGLVIALELSLHFYRERALP